MDAALYVRKYPPVVATGESLYAAAERIAVGWLHAEPPTDGGQALREQARSLASEHLHLVFRDDLVQVGGG